MRSRRASLSSSSTTCWRPGEPRRQPPAWYSSWGPRRRDQLPDRAQIPQGGGQPDGIQRRFSFEALMSDDIRPILVVGSVALDTVHTPTEVANEVLGGGASYFCVAGSLFAPNQLVAVVGDDFPAAHRALLESRNIDLGGLEVLKGKTFRWTARYSGIRLKQRETLDTQLNVFAGFHPALPAAYRSSRVIFLSNIQPELQLEVLDQVEEADFVACDTIKLWLDTAHAGLERVFRRVDCVIINDEEAVQFTGQRFLPSAAHVIRSYGPRAVIIKRGENGSLLFTQDRVFFAPAHPLETVP